MATPPTNVADTEPLPASWASTPSDPEASLNQPLLEKPVPDTQREQWKKRAIRFATLIPICTITLGVYYCYDLPGTHS